MSGETEANISGWTTDTLKEYVESRFTSQEKAVAAVASFAVSHHGAHGFHDRLRT
jgi:hypothetical protein